MSPPPVGLIIAVLLAESLGPVIWGFLCSRLRKRIFGLSFMFLPYLILVMVWPGLLDLRALPFFALYVVLALIGYLAGFLIVKRGKQKS